MAKGKKRKRVPEVLWRLFHNNARTLADTIRSVLPSPPPAVADCQCKGRRCLGCTGDKAMAYLIRPKDPSDYRKLLNQCFVVIPDEAPPFTSFDPHNRWSQIETVRRNIEMINREQPASSNVICTGYDKTNRMSSTVQLLTTTAWCLLLRRVGDSLMVYLLRHTSIFLPLPPRTHHQVAGFPISDLCVAFLKHPSKSGNYSSKFHFGSEKKRKRLDRENEIENPEWPSSLDDDFSPSSPSCIGCARNNFTPSTQCCQEKLSQKTKIYKTAISSGTEYLFNEISLPGKQCEQSSDVLITKKRVRKFSWQRHKKRRTLCSEDVGSREDKDNSCSGPQYGVKNYSRPYPQEGSCSCCLVFETLSKISRKALIDRQSIFYKVEKSPSIFPKKHILNSLKANYTGVNILFKDIFGSSDIHFTDPSVPCVHGTKSCLIKSTCLYHSLMKQLKILIRKVKGCQPMSLLDKHCGTLSLEQHMKTSRMLQESQLGEHMHNKNGTLHASELSFKKFTGINSERCTKILMAHDQLQPSMSYCLKKQVVSFIWAVCRSIIPQDLLGSPYNWRILRKNISKFVSLRRFEKFSLKQCTHKLKISKFPLLSNKHSLCYVSNNDIRHDKRDNPDLLQKANKHNAADAVRHKLLLCWMLWFFSRLVVPLMEANFYITESENGKQEVFYYRTTVWKMLKDQALASLRDGGYHKLTDASVCDIIRYRLFGFSRIRFRPKDTGFRVLANLRAPSRIPVKYFNPRNVKYKYYKSVNTVLQGVHVVLKGIQLKEPDKLGSSVFDYTDVYRKFVPFVNRLKQGSSTMPCVYVIVSDVSKAFDSIDQNRLLNVMEDVISHDGYPLSKSLQVGCTRKSFMVRQHLMLPLQDHNSRCSASPTSVAISTPHGILVKEEPSGRMKKSEIFSHLNEFIKHNVLQFDRKFYLQKVGIPQGCVLSSLLCSFYYGHLERNVIFPFLEKAGQIAYGDTFEQPLYQTSASVIHPQTGTDVQNCEYLLLRFIDDFLFISTSKEQASLFFSQLQRGFHGYNCYMNERKFGLNFVMDHSAGLEPKRLYLGGDGMSFLQWSGLLVNCSTLEIQADYSRYLNCHLSTSLTISWNDHPVRVLKSKLSDYLRPKCHPILYDANINSAAVVRLNIYQVFLLCAMKFNCYICNFSDLSAFSTECCMDAIETSLRYMHKLIERRMHVLQTNTGFRPIFKVGKKEVKWLGLTAFIRALSRKQSRYRELLLILRSKLNAHGEADISASLKYAVDDANSSVLWKIKY